jgi:hypothetical protein
MFDDDGVPVKAGDAVRFSYGIPPVVVDAPIVQRRGSLIALTPGHDPKECNLRSLRKQVSCWFKSEARPDPLTALQASKRKATRQRDNWKARAVKYKEGLELIAKYGGKTECEDGVACTGSWCAEQARTVLREGEENTSLDRPAASAGTVGGVVVRDCHTCLHKTAWGTWEPCFSCSSEDRPNWQPDAATHNVAAHPRAAQEETP